MALINCPECGNMLSDKAPRCPHCGSPNHKPMNKKVLITAIAIIATCSISIGVYYGLIIKPRQEFNEAHTMLMDGQVEEAYLKLQELKEEPELQKILYQAAYQLTHKKQYDITIQIIDKLVASEDTEKLILDINLGRAQEAFDSKDYEKTLELLNAVDSDKADTLRTETQYLIGKNNFDNGNYLEAISQLSLIKDYKEASSMISQANMLAMPKRAREAYIQNQDTIGWLYIPDTTVNHAVVQSNDNTSYLKLNEFKEYSHEGCYFADYECTLGSTAADLSRSTIIYGMNIYDSEGGVNESDDTAGYQDRTLDWFKYSNIEWAKEHPYFYFATPLETLKWEVFAVAYTNTDFNYIQVLRNRDISNEEITPSQMMNIVNGARARSEFDYNVDVNEADKIITLSTNSYKYGLRKNHNVRFIIMAKLVTDDDPVAEQATVTVNTDKIEIK